MAYIITIKNHNSLIKKVFNNYSDVEEFILAFWDDTINVIVEYILNNGQKGIEFSYINQ